MGLCLCIFAATTMAAPLRGNVAKARSLSGSDRKDRNTGNVAQRGMRLLPAAECLCLDRRLQKMLLNSHGEATLIAHSNIDVETNPYQSHQSVVALVLFLIFSVEGGAYVDDLFTAFLLILPRCSRVRPCDTSRVFVSANHDLLQQLYLFSSALDFTVIPSDPSRISRRGLHRSR